MTPRNTFTQHQKIHILRQFSVHSVTCVRDLAERYGVSKATLGSILDAGSLLREEGRVRATSSLNITFDFFQTTLANLEVKEVVSSGEEVVASLEIKRDASLQREEVEGLEVKEEPVSLGSEEGRSLQMKKENNKAMGEDSALTERLEEVSLDDIPPPSFSVGGADGKAGAGARHGLSRQELTIAMLTLRQVVETRDDIPMWFTFVLDSMVPNWSSEGNVWWGQSAGFGTVNLPPRQDLLSVLLVLRQALQNNNELPAWFTFTLSHMLQKYRGRRGMMSQDLMFNLKWR